MDTIDTTKFSRENCTLSDIEETLDRLIENQSMLNKIKEHYNLPVEVEALRKTQESLQAHLFFLGDVYESIQKSIKARLSDKMRSRIYEKAVSYQNLSDSTIGSFYRLFQPSSFRIRKRRKTVNK